MESPSSSALVQIESEQEISPADRDKIIRHLVADLPRALAEQTQRQNDKSSFSILLDTTYPPVESDVIAALRTTLPELTLSCRVSSIELFDHYSLQAGKRAEWPGDKIGSKRAIEQRTFYCLADMSPERQELVRQCAGGLFIDPSGGGYEGAWLDDVDWAAGWSTATHPRDGRDTKEFHVWVDWMGDEHEAHCLEDKVHAHRTVQRIGHPEFSEPFPEDAPFFAPLEHFATYGHETKRTRWDDVGTQPVTKIW